MKNVTLEKVSKTYYLVRATTDRFGENEIMFEGISIDDCLNYITRNASLQKIMVDVNTFEKYEIVKLIHKVTHEIADKLKCTPTSIGKITESGSDSVIYEVVEKTIKHTTTRWVDRKNKCQLADVLGLLYYRFSSVI